MHRIGLLYFFLTIGLSAFAQPKSPDEFLGYPIGTKFTSHWKIVDYFNHIAEKTPATVKLIKYGETNEGRPLLTAFISSSENIGRLESIRNNNMLLVNSTDKNLAVDASTPAIVWLSYNVHGNETSSSEAAMMTLWSLVDPQETKTNAWLKNTVVVIDPCINPDGRDRYVNWFNAVSGKTPNPQIVSREHREPWPGGRTNHYNFDLNRDWAWQTQVESQQRMKLYNSWMPQIHVDFHEQGVNEPYYFAPAAQPYHDVITKWQRDFQLTIGKNHAKYFDEKGWLYFTREFFDLYYPSYGDTYPTYNGAIGMTYEQGGGPAGGLAVINDEGDTLTLLDRATHHYTTSLSTIEIASQNSGSLVKEFRKFFNDASSSGVGEYKSYVILNHARDKERISALLDLLDKNGITYSYGSGNGKGYNYSSGKDETFSANNNIIISALQPRSAMVKVLFEPKAKLVDSATYDITAWSLPYAYGLDAYASREKLNTAPTETKVFIPNPSATYGYVLPWTGTKAVKTAGKLLQKGITLRYAEQPFEVNGNSFERGSVIILNTANRSAGVNFLNEVKKIADENKVKLFPVSTGFVDKGFDFGSDKVHPFRAPAVALLTGEGVSSYGAGEVWHFFENDIDYPLNMINVNDISRVDWTKIDVLIMPDGNYRFLSDKTLTDQFRSWINKGGKVIAVEGAVAALAQAEFGIKVRKPDEADDKKNSYDLLKKYEDRERDFIPDLNAGSIYRVELDNTHPLGYGYPGYYHTLKLDDKVYDFLKEGWNAGVIRKDNQVAGFVGARLKEKLKDGLVFGTQSLGSGTIVYLTDNVLFRNFWENGKLMFCNAVFLAGK